MAYSSQLKASLKIKRLRTIYILYWFLLAYIIAALIWWFIALSNQNQMMTFPAINDFKIAFSPEMPSMGHGSPNNVNPVNIGNGHYKGKVNYTMTGDWRLHFKISKNDVVIVDDATIDILF